MADCCPNGPRGGITLVTRTFGSSGLCRGDIAQVVDSSSRTFAGSCSLGEFVPVPRRPLSA